MNKTVNGRYEDKKSVSLRLFLVLCIFCIGAPVANTFLPVVPVPAEYSVGEGYFYFNADMKFGVEMNLSYVWYPTL